MLGQQWGIVYPHKARGETAMTFETVPMHTVRVGEMFLPLEKAGSRVYAPKRHRYERQWRKADRAYVCTGVARGTDETGRDGIFSLYDWAIVRRSGVNPSKLDRLVSKFGKQS